MEVIVGNSGFNDDYLLLTNQINSDGKNISPRGLPTKEIRPVMLRFLNPRARIISVPYRDINPFFLVVEALWILAGKDDVATLDIYNGNIKQFSDNGIQFHAAYGKRLRSYGFNFESKTILKNTSFKKNEETGLDEIVKLYSETYEPVIDQLKGIVTLFNKDENTRKAVASIWNVFSDLNVKTADTPCNDLLMFKIRDNKLSLSIANRSNDLHWGLPTNLFQFSMILEVMSYILEVGVGEQIHFTDSLHIYMNNDITETIIKNNKNCFQNNGERLYIDNMFNVYDYVKPMKFEMNVEALTTKEDEFDRVFNEIEKSITAIQDFENQFNEFYYQRSLVNREEDGVTFHKIFFDSRMKIESVYLHSLVDFALVYFLYKKILDYKKDNEKFSMFLFDKMLDVMFNVKQQDFVIVGLNFLFTRLYKNYMKNNSLLYSIFIEKFSKNVYSFLKANFLDDEKVDELCNYICEIGGRQQND